MSRLWISAWALATAAFTAIPSFPIPWLTAFLDIGDQLKDMAMVVYPTAKIVDRISGFKVNDTYHIRLVMRKISQKMARWFRSGNIVSMPMGKNGHLDFPALAQGSACFWSMIAMLMAHMSALAVETPVFTPSAVDSATALDMKISALRGQQASAIV